MPIIQPVNGMMLLKAFRMGSEDGIRAREHRANMDKAAAEAEESRQAAGILANMFVKPKGVATQLGVPEQPTASQTPGSVSGQLTRPPSYGTPGIGDGIPGNKRMDGSRVPFDQAFGPDTQQALATGAELPALPTAAPQHVEPQPEQRPRMELNPEMFMRYAGIRPQQAMQIVNAIKTADEIGLKRMETKNVAMGAAALSMSQIPLAQRPQYLRDVLMPYLSEAGWTEPEIAGRLLTDKALAGYQNQAMTMHQALEAERASRNTDSLIEDRQAQREETRRWHDMYDTTRRRGQDVTARTTRRGQDMRGSGGGRAKLPTVSSPEEAAKLPPGTKFRTPDGTIRVRP